MSTQNFSQGTKVTLGDGRKGTVVRKEERQGFSGYIVRITESLDKTQIGQTVGASPDGMKKFSQGQMSTSSDPNAPSVPNLTPVKNIGVDDKQKQFYQEQTQIKQKQVQLLQEEINSLSKMSGRRWIKSECANAHIEIGDNTIICDVAATPRQQSSGLQAYDELLSDRGLWFPQSVRRVASFHMGEVKFPIDIIFVDNGRIAKIVSNVGPRQPGSWSNVCTDVIEVNGGWCSKNEINIGYKVSTPISHKAAVDLGLALHRSRRERAKKMAGHSYDLLRTITEADRNNSLEDELKALFPHRFKEAQENRQVKPDTHNLEPGDRDPRNPLERFKNHDLGDVSSPEGEDNPDLVMGGDSSGYSRSNSEFQMGYDPATFREEDHPYAVRPSAQRVQVEAPEPTQEMSGVDVSKMAQGLVRVFEKFPPEWANESGEDGWEVAIINDRIISEWIDSLGFDEAHESILRKNMFTDESKRILGEALIKAGYTIKYETLDSDLILYR